MKSGVQWAASWLAPFGFEIVDQISEAATLEAEVMNSQLTNLIHLSTLGRMRKAVQRMSEDFSEGYIQGGNLSFEYCFPDF